MLAEDTTAADMPLTALASLETNAFNSPKEKTVFAGEKKDLIYALGCVLEKRGKPEEAIEQFKLIYETDISFKDVAAKVDAYYAGQ